MKNYVLKYIKSIGIVVLLCIIFIGGGISCNRMKDLKDLEKALEISNQTTQYFENKNGELVAEKEAIQLTADQFKKNGEDLGFENKRIKETVGRMNRLVSDLQGKLRVARNISNIPMIEEIVSDTTINEGGEVIVIDTKTQTFDFKDDYLEFDGKIMGGELFFNYMYNVDFSVTTFWKPTGFLKPKDLVIDVVFKDPNARVLDLKSIVIKPERKKFYETTWFKVGVGFVGGYILFK